MPTTNKSLVQQVYNTSTGNLPANQVVDPAYISTPYPNWSVPVNYDFGALDLALGGLVTISVTGVLTDQTMVLSQYQPMFIVFSGTLSANIKYSLPSSVGGTWAVYNNTTGAFTLSMGSPTGPTTVTIPAGGPYNVTCNSSTGIAFVNGYNATNSIATAMIQNDAVTTAKIADSSSPTTGVTTAKLASSSSTTNGVTYAKMQYVSTTSRLLGRATAGSGVVEEVTGSQALDFIGSTQGDILYRGTSAWVRLAAGTNGQLLRTNGASANLSWQSVPVQGTSQAFSGSSITFTSIPATAKMIIISVDQMGTASSVNSLVRLGTSSGVVTTGYQSSGSRFQKDSGDGGDGTSDTSTVGFIIAQSSLIVSGTIRLTNVSGNTWVCDHTFGVGNNSYTVFGGGRIALSGVLDRVQLATTSGNFDAAGSANVLYL